MTSCPIWEEGVISLVENLQEDEFQALQTLKIGRDDRGRIIVPDWPEARGATIQVLVKAIKNGLPALDRCEVAASKLDKRRVNNAITIRRLQSCERKGHYTRSSGDVIVIDS